MIGKDEFAARFDQVYQTAKMRDRGSIKWTAMMLPEHTAQLREDVANYNKVERPQLDEYDLQTLHEEIERAIISKAETKTTTWRDGEFSHIRGVIEEITPKWLIIDGPFGSMSVSLDSVVGVMLLE
ncbi:MAG: YolD-like family protein [Paenisporosarcina sp.]